MGEIKDNYKLLVIKPDGKYDFTGLVDGFIWTSDVDTLGSQLTFSLANVPGQLTIDVGDIISLINNGVDIFRGIMTDDDGGRIKKDIIAFDFAWYLNKSQCPIQFKRAKASNAIEQLCLKMGVPIGQICPMGTLITKIYKSENVADIIRDIISQYELESGQKIRMEMLAGKLNIYKWGDLILNLPHITGYFGSDWNMKRSIANLVNSVVATKDDSSVTVQDPESIGRYGLLQEMIDVDQEQNSRTQAQALLKEKNVIPNDLTLPLLGDDSLLAGRILMLPDAINGKWLIKSVKHTLVSGIHKCDVTLKKVVA